MSSQQQYSEYLYFTLHTQQDISVQKVMQDYAFDQMHHWTSAWDKEQLNDEGTHLFDAMCIRFDLDPITNIMDFSQHVSMWLHQFKFKTHIRRLPVHFEKTLHLVTHGANTQNAGFHLSHSLIRALTDLNINFHLHGYLDQDDEQDFPYSRQINTLATSEPSSERAYFWLSSAQLSAVELQQLLANLNMQLGFQVKQDQGIRLPSLKSAKSKTKLSIIQLESNLTPSDPINQHIQYLLAQLMPYQTQLQNLFFNAEISFGINATGYLENPHHRLFTAATLKQLFLLGIDLDADLYFA